MPTIHLWLNEGVAEFFEFSRREQGVHAVDVAHLSGRMLKGTWRPDLDRMEALTSASELSRTTMRRSGAGRTACFTPRSSAANSFRITLVMSAATARRPRSLRGCGMPRA